jgi:hypothetical protein
VTRHNPAVGKVELVQGLTAGDLRVQIGTNAVTVTAISIDHGAKRVAIVLDASKGVPDDEWKLETNMAARLVGQARPDDQFIIAVAGQDNATGAELSAAAVAQQHLRELADHRPAVAVGEERIYDTLLAAAKGLNPPAFGDSLFLFGHPDDSGSTASVEEIRAFFLKNQLRFYAVSFTDPLKGKLPRNFNLNYPLPIRSPVLTNVSADTGYFFSFHSVDQLKLPGQTALFEHFLADLYSGIASPHRITIPIAPSADELKVEVTIGKNSELGIHKDEIHYPHIIYSCKDANHNVNSVERHAP